MKKIVLAIMAIVSLGAHAADALEVAGSPCGQIGATTQPVSNYALICANGQWRDQRTDAPYAATAGDGTLYTLIARWAATNGLQARWGASAIPPVIRDPAHLNETAHLESARTFEDAFTRLAKSYRGEHPDAPPLVACVYKGDHIVAVSAGRCGGDVE
jgi:hypothetical protein